MNAPHQDKRPKILVVDDAPSSLRAMRQVLRILEADVIAVGSGREALIQCMEHEFALVFLDVQMEEMDGYETAELLRSAEHTSELPIVFLTAAYADPQHAVRGYDLGAVDYVYKPVDDRILVAKAAVFLKLFNQRRQLLQQASALHERNVQLETSMASQHLAEQRNRTVVENMPVLVAALDDAGRVAAWNRACEQATGYCAKEIVGNPKVLELLYPAPSRLESLLKTWQGRNDAPEAVSVNFETLRKDGSSALLAWFNISRNHPISGWSSWSVGFDVTERERLASELLQSREDLRRLANHIQAIREEEKRSISREVHDEMGSYLTRLKMDLLRLKRDAEARDQGGEVLTGLDHTLFLVEETLEKARNVSQNLRPTVLDQFGLLAGLEWLATEYGRRSDMPCAVRSGSINVRLDDERETILFRVCQEGLTNVIRHAQATRALVSLNLIDNHVVLTIEDNGVGLDPETIQSRQGSSLGLLSMTERLRLAGGILRIERRLEGGTRIVASVPRLPGDRLEAWR